MEPSRTESCLKHPDSQDDNDDEHDATSLFTPGDLPKSMRTVPLQNIVQNK